MDQKIYIPNSIFNYFKTINHMYETKRLLKICKIFGKLSSLKIMK